MFRSQTCSCERSKLAEAENLTDKQVSFQQHEPVLEVFAERYQVTGHLGSGNTASIDKAYDTLLQRIVAIKRLKLQSKTDEHVVRFQREARALCKLQHANLIHVIDFGIAADEQPYMVMELLEGRSIAEALKAGELFSINTAIAIAVQVCEGMSHAHSKGIVHRDLSSNNIIILKSQTELPVVKVIDFGVASVETADDAANQLALTIPGQIMGTPAYMSPEQAQGNEVDGRTDIYSLGCVLFEMLSGTPPFRGATTSDVVFKHLHDPIPSLVDRMPENKLIAPLQAIVTRAMAKRADDRFDSMESLRTALLSILYATQKIRPGSLRDPAESHGAIAQTGRSPIRLPLITLLFVGLVVASAFGFLQYQRDNWQPNEKASAGWNAMSNEASKHCKQAAALYLKAYSTARAAGAGKSELHTIANLTRLTANTLSAEEGLQVYKAMVASGMVDDDVDMTIRVYDQICQRSYKLHRYAESAAAADIAIVGKRQKRENIMHYISVYSSAKQYDKAEAIIQDYKDTKSISVDSRAALYQQIAYLRISQKRAAEGSAWLKEGLQALISKHGAASTQAQTYCQSSVRLLQFASRPNDAQALMNMLKLNLLKKKLQETGDQKS